MTQFRPISLCSVVYKLIAISSANRFRKLLDIYIDEAQIAFMPGQQITNNVLIAYEIP